MGRSQLPEPSEGSLSIPFHRIHFQSSQAKGGLSVSLARQGGPVFQATSESPTHLSLLAIPVSGWPNTKPQPWEEVIGGALLIGGVIRSYTGSGMFRVLFHIYIF